MDEREKNGPRKPSLASHVIERIPFTREMKKNHTILAPQLSPIHFRMIEAVFNRNGYRTRILENASNEDIETGLKFVNNDACYPSILVVGQLVNALLSGEYDPDNCSVVITQTGGGCRATNYVAFLRKALREAGFPQVPVVALSAGGIEKNPALPSRLSCSTRLPRLWCWVDLLQTVLLRVRPYEVKSHSANALYQYWDQVTREWFLNDGYPPLLGRKISYKG